MHRRSWDPKPAAANRPPAMPPVGPSGVSRPKYDATPRTYIPSAHLTAEQAGICRTQAAALGVVYAHLTEKDFIERNRTRKPRPSLAPYAGALCAGLAFLGGLLAGRMS